MSTSIAPASGGALRRVGETSAVSAMMPPSPQLSARMTNARYLIEMTRMSDQTMSESSPGRSRASAALRACRGGTRGSRRSGWCRCRRRRRRAPRAKGRQARRRWDARQPRGARGSRSSRGHLSSVCCAKSPDPHGNSLANTERLDERIKGTMDTFLRAAIDEARRDSPRAASRSARCWSSTAGSSAAGTTAACSGAARSCTPRWTASKTPAG